MIHPKHVDVVNAAFMPTEEEIAWSQKIVKAFDDNPKSGVVKIDGKMIDKPHLRAAVKILALVASKRSRRVGKGASLAPCHHPPDGMRWARFALRTLRTRAFNLFRRFNMRLTAPRVAPVPLDGCTAEQREIVEPMLARGKVLNIFRTMLTHPVAARAFLAWGGYILSKKSTLPPREREIVILRTGFLCRSGYEWTQHVPIGKRAGLTDDEIARIKLGADAPGWSAADAALLRAADDLHREQFVTEPVWAELSRHLSENASAWTWCSRSASTPRSRCCSTVLAFSSTKARCSIRT